MGLDKQISKCLNERVAKLRETLGLGWAWLGRVVGIEKKASLSPLDRDRRHFEAEVRQQFLKLKEKGLSIPIFTL